MRPSNKPTGEVWRLLEEWSADHALRPNQTQMGRLFGVSTSLFSNWKFMESVMQPSEMKVVSDATGINIGDLAAAVAADARTKELMGNAEHPAATSKPGDSPGNVTKLPQRKEQETRAPRRARAARKVDEAKFRRPKRDGEE